MIARTFGTLPAPPNWILGALETQESRQTFKRLKSAVFSWLEVVLAGFLAFRGAEVGPKVNPTTYSN